MRLVCSLVALAALHVSAGFSQSALPAAQLEAFEQFAQRPTAREVWSEEIGRIVSDRASAVITALAVEDSAPGAEPMRGIRIELTEGDRTDRLYTSEAHLDRLITEMQEIANARPAPTAGAENYCHGSGLFWLQTGHVFTASACVYGEWSGLAVHPGDFRFTNTSAKAFGDLFAAGKSRLSR